MPKDFSAGASRAAPPCRAISPPRPLHEGRGAELLPGLRRGRRILGADRRRGFLHLLDDTGPEARAPELRKGIVRAGQERVNRVHPVRFLERVSVERLGADVVLDVESPARIVHGLLPHGGLVRGDHGRARLCLLLLSLAAPGPRVAHPDRGKVRQSSLELVLRRRVGTPGKMDRVQRVLALDDKEERALWLSRSRALRDPREEPAGREPAHGDRIAGIDLRTLARRPEGVRLGPLILRERGAVSSNLDRDQPGPVGHRLVLGHELDGPIDVSRTLRAELPAERYGRQKVLAGWKGRHWGIGDRGQDGSREQREGERKTNHTSLYAPSRPGRLLMCDLGDEVAGNAEHLVIAAVGRDSCAGRSLARQYTSSRSPNSKAS